MFVFLLPSQGCWKPRVRYDADIAWFGATEMKRMLFIHISQRCKPLECCQNKEKFRISWSLWGWTQRSEVRWTSGVFLGRRNRKPQEQLFNTCFLLLAHRTHRSIFTERNQVMKSYNSLVWQYKKKDKSCSWLTLHIDTVVSPLQRCLPLNPNRVSSRHCLHIMTFSAEVKVDGEKDTGGRT